MRVDDTMPAEGCASGHSVRCPFCRSSDARVVWRQVRFEARQCRCGVLFVHPEPSDEEVHATLDLHTDGYYRLPAAQRLAFVKRFAPHGDLLEVGFGPGHFLSLAQSSGYSVRGVDPNPTAVQRARRAGLAVDECDIESSTLPEGSFDVVFHVDLLSHLRHPAAALRAMRRKLRPGGVLAFEIGVLGAMHPLWYRWWGGLSLPQHRQMFSEEALVRLLAESGFEVVGVDRFGLLLASVVLGARRGVEVLARGQFPRPHDVSGLPAETRGLQVVYERMMMAARYGAGRWIPIWGPYTMFIAARARVQPSVDPS